MLWLRFELPSCVFINTRDTSVMQEKAKLVCFIYMQPLKVKFKSVQIYMKQVLYYNFKFTLHHSGVGDYDCLFIRMLGCQFGYGYYVHWQ